MEQITNTLPPIKYIDITKVEKLPIENQFSVLSYNILADCYTYKRFFPYARDHQLKFARRSSLIIRQLKEINSDVICLQEVDNFKKFYQKELENLNYQVIFFQKVDKDDGIVIGYKKDRFKEIDEKAFEYNIEQEKLLQNSYMQKNQNVLILKLEDLKSKKNFIIANTHLFWDPKCEHVKYLQAATLYNYMNSYANLDDNVIICGDFNSSPSSNPIQLLLNQATPTLDTVEAQFKKNVNLQIMNKIHQIIVDKKFHLNFESAYKYYNQGNYPDYTTFTNHFRVAIDHILFNKNKNLKLLKLLEIPSTYINQLKLQGIPSDNFPSDHLPIQAILQFQ